ncbi:epoxyqueuosine reductase QueH [bacterium]|nr:epoxyqueuosine reductase QueH [bacterium]
MKVLLHICCAPCSAYPIEALTDEDFSISGFWYNPNIHPYLEYKKRLFEVRRFLKILKIPLIERDVYALVPFLKKILNRQKGIHRCDVCYELRLRETARIAAENGFDAFTTTMLYSKHLRHNAIRQIGENIARESGVEFLYRDFRTGWSRGLKLSRKYKLYRQQYCGCVISEFERFHRTADKVLEYFEWVPRRKEIAEDQSKNSHK